LSPARSTAVLALLLLLLAAFAALSLTIGAVAVSPSGWWEVVFGGDPRGLGALLFDFRLPRMLTALASGAALAVAGLLMQTWFRNPLAGPDLLGITTGATLGAALAVLGTGGMLGGLFARFGVTSSAVLGAFFALLLIMLVGTRVRGNLALLVSGMMLSFLMGAVVSMLTELASANQVQSLVSWSFGSFGEVSRGRLPFLLLPVGAGLLLAVASVRSLDALLLGEEHARSLGIPIHLARVTILASAALLSGGVTAWCGPVAFIGLAVPHLARLALGTSRHALLLPGCALIGASLALGADAATFLPGGGRILPLNAMTSLLGAPVVLWIVLSGRHQQSLA